MACTVLGCATVSGWTRSQAERSTLSPAALAEAGQPWTLPADALATQRLYRVKYDGPEGKLNFKLTLYLEAADRYRLLAADPLGRKLWELSLEPGDQAVLIDHRGKRYCQHNSANLLTVVPLARLPLLALPQLLLGRLPAKPAAELQLSETTASYRDAQGQLWQAGLERGRLQWWSLVEAGQAIAWWRPAEDGAGGIFSDRRGQQQVRWREVIQEQLMAPLERPEVPPKYELGDCIEAE